MFLELSRVAGVLDSTSAPKRPRHNDNGKCAPPLLGLAHISISIADVECARGIIDANIYQRLSHTLLNHPRSSYLITVNRQVT